MPNNVPASFVGNSFSTFAEILEQSPVLKKAKKTNLYVSVEPESFVDDQPTTTCHACGIVNFQTQMVHVPKINRYVCGLCYRKHCTCAYCNETVAPADAQLGVPTHKYCPTCGPRAKKLDIPQKNFKAKTNILAIRKEKVWGPIV